MEGTSTLGTSTRAWKGAAGPGALASFPNKQMLLAFGGEPKQTHGPAKLVPREAQTGGGGGCWLSRLL